MNPISYQPASSTVRAGDQRSSEIEALKLAQSTTEWITPSLEPRAISFFDPVESPFVEPTFMEESNIAGSRLFWVLFCGAVADQHWKQAGTELFDLLKPIMLYLAGDLAIDAWRYKVIDNQYQEVSKRDWVKLEDKSEAQRFQLAALSNLKRGTKEYSLGKAIFLAGSLSSSILPVKLYSNYILPMQYIALAAGYLFSAYRNYELSNLATDYLKKV